MSRFEAQTQANAEMIPPGIRKIACPNETLQIEKEKEGGYIQFTNFLQMAMAIRLYGMMEDNGQLQIWQRAFSSDFRTAFQKMAKEEPDFFADISTIGDIPEEKWAKLEEKVYTKAD